VGEERLASRHQKKSPRTGSSGGESIVFSRIFPVANNSRTLLTGTYRVNADLLAHLVLVFERNTAVGKGEQSVVPAHSHIVSRVKFGPKLPYDDIAGTHEFTAELLYASSLAGAVTAVSGTSSSFLMCHHDPPNRAEYQNRRTGASEHPAPLLSDIFHAHGRITLPVPLLLPIVLAALVLENHNLRETPVFDNFGLDRNTFHQRLPELHLVSIGEQEHLVEDNILSDFAGDFLHPDYMTGPGFVLPAIRLENGIHDFKPPEPALSGSL
jgi:hypothetical protein